MFGQKSKHKEQAKELEVRLDGKVLFSGSLIELPLKDEWIVKKCVEFFNDPEPCFIHRGAVSVRLLNEIWDAAENGGVESEYVEFPQGAVINRRLL